MTSTREVEGNMDTIGERIKERRKTLGLTQVDLSGPELSHAMISLIERNRTKPSLKTLEYIASKLGVTLSYLMEETNVDDKKNHENFNEIDIGKIVGICKSLIALKKFEEVKNKITVYLNYEMSPSNKGILLKMLGQIYMNDLEYQKAIEEFNAALIYLSPLDSNEYIEVHYDLAICNKMLKRYDKCITNSLYSLSLLKANFYTENTVLQLKILYNLSYCYCELQEYEKGLSTINQAIQIMNESSLYYHEGNFYVLKGTAELYLQDYQQAISSTKHALKHLESPNNIQALLNLGVLYRETKEYDLAQQYIQESLQISINCSNKENELKCYFELAITYYKSLDYDKVEEMYKRIINDCDQFKDIKFKFSFLMACTKYAQGLHDESLMYLNELELDINKCNIKLLLPKIYFLKSKIYENQGDIQNAIRFLKESIQTMDGINNKLYNIWNLI